MVRRMCRFPLSTRLCRAAQDVDEMAAVTERGVVTEAAEESGSQAKIRPIRPPSGIGRGKRRSISLLARRQASLAGQVNGLEAILDQPVSQAGVVGLTERLQGLLEILAIGLANVLVDPGSKARIRVEVEAGRTSCGPRPELAPDQVADILEQGSTPWPHFSRIRASNRRTCRGTRGGNARFGWGRVALATRRVRGGAFFVIFDRRAASHVIGRRPAPGSRPVEGSRPPDHSAWAGTCGRTAIRLGSTGLHIVQQRVPLGPIGNPEIQLSLQLAGDVNPVGSSLRVDTGRDAFATTRAGA